MLLRRRRTCLSIPGYQYNPTRPEVMDHHLISTQVGAAPGTPGSTPPGQRLADNGRTEMAQVQQVLPYDPLIHGKAQSMGNSQLSDVASGSSPQLTSCLHHQKVPSVCKLCYLRIHDAKDTNRGNIITITFGSSGNLVRSMYPDSVQQKLHDPMFLQFLSNRAAWHSYCSTFRNLDKL